MFAVAARRRRRRQTQGPHQGRTAWGEGGERCDVVGDDLAGDTPLVEGLGKRWEAVAVAVLEGGHRWQKQGPSGV